MAPGEKREVSLALVVVAVLIVATVGYAIVDEFRGGSKPKAEAPAAPALVSNALSVDPAAASVAAPPPVSMAPPPVSMAPPPEYQKMRALEALKSDLRRFVTMQEVRYAEQMMYARNPSELPDFNGLPGVRLTVTSASESGYGVYGTHDDLPGVRCAFYVGNALPVSPATVMGRLSCDEPK